ncbi:MAG TPA: polysaccharide deacetylase family protein [Caldimonas sp.]|nr:polysaccharide deacetylase family protein [Caldimonas sp.]
MPELPSAAEFERRMRWVRQWFQVLPLARAIERLYEGSIPSRALAITFDDGYADNETIAAPLLARLGLTATFFVSTGYLEGGSMFNDRIIEAIRGAALDEIDLDAIGLGRRSLANVAARRLAIDAILEAVKHQEPQRREAATEAVVRAAGARPSPPSMMRAGQVRALRAAGMDIGAHTVTHPILTRITAPEARAEMQASKQALEAIVDARVDLFAYPNGVPGRDYGPEHIAMARDCGFDAAVSTAWGAASMRSDRFQLPRFTPWDRTRLRFGLRMVGNFTRSEVTVG